MTDTERLDAIGEYGLFISTQDVLKAGTWVCCYGDRMVFAASMRDAIDMAVMDIKTGGVFTPLKVEKNTCLHRTKGRLLSTHGQR